MTKLPDAEAEAGTGLDAFWNPHLNVFAPRDLDGSLHRRARGGTNVRARRIVALKLRS
jgi:hypothetical protein